MKALGLIHCPLVFPPRGSKPSRGGTYRRAGRGGRLVPKLAVLSVRPYTWRSTNSGYSVRHVSGYPCLMTARLTDISEIGFFPTIVCNLQQEKDLVIYNYIIFAKPVRFLRNIPINYLTSQNPINNIISFLSFFGGRPAYKKGP